METVGLIAGRGIYPFEWVAGARRAGVKRIVAAAFEDETDPKLTSHVDEIHWMRVGQLGKLIKTFQKSSVAQAVMAGQIRPGNLFSLKPDIKALFLLSKLKQRNAETLFSAIANELAHSGVTLLPATQFLEDQIVPQAWSAGPKIKLRFLDDARYAFRLAKQMSALDIGQTVIVKKGTVLAVEAFEGTNDAIRRAGTLGKEAIAAKVSKPNQDFRFDVPVIGPQTLEVAAQANLMAIALEAEKTLLLQKEKIIELAFKYHITILSLN